MKTGNSFLLIIFFAANALSQSPAANLDTYQAYLTQDISKAKASWKKIEAEAKEKYGQNKNDPQLLYQLTLIQFGLLSFTMRDRDEAMFDAYADAAEANLETLIKNNKTWGEPKAMLSSFYGFKMGYTPVKGIILGSKSQSLMSQALKDSPASPLVWQLYANSKYFTPEAWGGDLKESVRAYIRSVQLYESDPEKTKNNWLYLDALAFFGQVYLKDAQPLKAVDVFEKALKTEPRFLWVKNQLLPKALKAASSN